MIRVAIAPSPAADETTRTVEASGGVVNPLGQAEVLVWQPNSADGLQQALSAGPGLKWAQLTSAGVDWLLESSVVHPSVVREGKWLRRERCGIGHAHDAVCGP